jgi:hypothetical protein
MLDAGTRKILVQNSAHTCPGPGAGGTLTAAAQDAPPQTTHRVDKAAYADRIARDGVIIEPALHGASQPASGFAKRIVHPQTKLGF